MVLAGEVEIGREVHDRRDAAAIAPAEGRERRADRGVGGQVAGDDGDRSSRRFEIESDDPVIAPERTGERGADVAGRTGDENDRLSSPCHARRNVPLENPLRRKHAPRSFVPRGSSLGRRGSPRSRAATRRSAAPGGP
jgi:hypothetical protein